ncbi:MAG TPA: hypothetical protein VMA73_05275 [Streptosporangiaceae bacterium]|nr:hypothetical protein [Streptosporangiaceae bacterium]
MTALLEDARMFPTWRAAASVSGSRHDTPGTPTRHHNDITRTSPATGL